MTVRPKVLLVAPTPGVATTMFGWLSEAGCDLTIVSSFASAKVQLERQPCLLISEVRLGEYNGLHLALRAQACDIPALVLGEPDAVLEREARQIGATYLPRNIDREHLLAVTEPITSAAESVAANRHMPAPGLSFLSWRDALPPFAMHASVRSSRRRPLPS